MGNGNKSLRAVLFDVDGTLADTERDGHRVAFNAAFGELGLDWNWDIDLYGELLKITGGKERIHYYMKNYAPPGTDRLDRDGLDSWIASLHKVKTKHYVSLLEQGGIPLRPGVARVIQDLRDANIKIAIATTTTEENVTALLKSTLGEDSLGWFDVIGAGDIVPGKKPEPDIYHWALEQLGLSAQQCIAVEDSENGLRSSLAAGLDTVVTVNDYTRVQNFNGAALVLSDLGEPTQPFAVLEGHAFDNGWVDAELLLKLKG
ncbi:HAD family hydrolase [Nitrosovibrio tenuis]|uniref:Haloacid dehalogenase superfamily, subfamily IA, variant 3 with third motif having DD or ED n=1 Tax=Nitrosovibrio tenuis TaxID=1233 RepID=A0A1H7GMY6_9PROT|nr:HAD family hydrolase [Nitrosovibrio tenuis]SEK38907.1 haloacid dehalogenase superfamily, subfamily IA, variant 3 with third motif having DD or ED [Nitrosovibrio tenuis]